MARRCGSRKRLYFAVNKPVGVVTTNFDPRGRERVIDLVPTEERVFAVGRLDRTSEGLILVTNDGEFANRITHPRYGVEKTYLVRVAGAPNHKQLARLKKGVHLAEGFAGAVDRRQEAARPEHRPGDRAQRRPQPRDSPHPGPRRPQGAGAQARRRRADQAGRPAARRLAAADAGRRSRRCWLLAKEKRREAKQRKKGPGVRGQGSGSQEPEVGSRRSRSRRPEGNSICRKQALLAEPLSLDDLLRDDMDEGPSGGRRGKRVRRMRRHGQGADAGRRDRL